MIGQSDEQTGQSICAFVTLEGDLDVARRSSTAERADRRSDRETGPTETGGRSGDLPKTRSGKIIRGSCATSPEGRRLGDVTTLRDPAVTEELEEKVAARRAEEG